MKTPEWMQPALYGAAAGAVAIAVVGFSALGWVTGGTAEARASSTSKSAVLAALTPVCLERANLDPNRDSVLAQINDARAPQKRALLIEAGWATMPGNTTPNRDLADACQKALSTI